MKSPLRSLVRVKLPRYFNPEVFIWNKFAAADGLLVDVRCKRHETEVDGAWRRHAIQRALEGAPYRSRIFVQPTPQSRSVDLWKDDIRECANEKIQGFVVHSTDGHVAWKDAKETLRLTDKRLGKEGRKALPHNALHATLFPKHTAVIVDIQFRVVPFAILMYGGTATRASELAQLSTMVDRLKAAGVRSLATRSFKKVENTKMIEAEFQSLKSLGFSGVMLKNPDLIGMANDIFQ